jgi:2-hydroxychromene-2-carboxylate isomerase
MHPAAVLKGLELRSVREELAAQTTRAADLGVRDVPAFRVCDRIFHGDAALPGAAEAAAA